MGLLSTTHVRTEERNYSTTNITVDNTMSPKAIEQSNKIRKAIINDMLDECHIQDNILNGVVVAIANSPAFDRRVHVYIRFKLNGKDYECREEIPTDVWGSLMSTKEEVRKRLFEWMIRVVSATLLHELNKVGKFF